MDEMQLHPHHQQTQTGNAIVSAEHCSSGTRAEEVNNLANLPALRYPSCAVQFPARATQRLPRSKPIAGLPVGAGPEDKYRHMPSFDDCALKKRYPPGVRTRLYN
jgi:hypothetical protein